MDSTPSNNLLNNANDAPDYHTKDLYIGIADELMELAILTQALYSNVPLIAYFHRLLKSVQIEICLVIRT